MLVILLFKFQTAKIIHKMCGFYVISYSKLCKSINSIILSLLIRMQHCVHTSMLAKEIPNEHWEFFHYQVHRRTYRMNHRICKVLRIYKIWIDYCEDAARSCEHLNFPDHLFKWYFAEKNWATSQKIYAHAILPHWLLSQ